MTNTVKPKITIPGGTTIWFDPAGGTETPAKVQFSIDQTDAANFPYRWGGTIIRDHGNIELFRDQNATQPIVFSENRARVTNAELLTVNPDASVGFVAWIRGTRSSADVGTNTTLRLELDLLETSERKKTNFATGAKTNTINVANADAGGTKALTFKQASVITPTMVIGALDDPDTRIVGAASTPVVFSRVQVDTDSTKVYDGDGILTITPADAKLGLFTDAKATIPVTITNGEAKIPFAALRDQTVFYLARTADVSASGIELALTLGPGSDPTNNVTHGTAARTVSLVPVNTVTPTMALTIPGSLDGTLWFPSPAAVDPPSIALSVTQSSPDTARYLGNATLVRSAARVQLFRDRALSQPLPFFDDRVVLSNAELTGDAPLTLYLGGVAAGDVDLELTAYDPKQRTIVVGDAQTSTIAVEAVNLVTPKIEYGGTLVAGRLTAVRISAVQSNAGAGAYDKDGQLRRPSLDIAVFTGKDEQGAGTGPVFNGNDLSATIRKEDLADPNKVYYAVWQGDNPPVDPAQAGLSLTLPDSAKPYIVTQPSVQLRSPALDPPQATVGGSVTVTPKIETEYDLVLVDNGDEPATRTTPVRARFYVQRTPELGAYGGDGTLQRDTPNIEVYLDPECTTKMNFSATGAAIIPNAKLIDSTVTYYLQGAAASTAKLTLTAAKPSNGFPSLPAVTVGPPAVKSLGITKLELVVYRDDGTVDPPTANTVALSDSEQRTRGRFVHVQSGTLYGRAKVVVTKVDTSTWPDSANNHEVRLSITATSDKLTLYSAATGGSVKGTRSSPVLLNKGQAGGQDNPLFAQGDLVSDDLRDIRLDLGISRTDASVGFLQTKPLRNGHWAAMTSVKITEVKPNADDWKQYVNLPPDPTLVVNDNGDDAKKGRHILATAQLDPPKANIGVDFMLWGFDGNGDAAVGTPRVPRIPAALEATDAHVTSLSDGTGKASARIEASRYGGDKFYAVAFLADDAAAGTAELGLKGNTAPNNTKSKPIEVWRKIFYTLTAMARYNGGSYAARADAANFEAQFVPAFIEMEGVGGTNVIGHQATVDKTAAKALGGIPAPAERTVNITLLDMITRPGEAPASVDQFIAAPTTLTPTKVIDGLYDPNDFLVSNSGNLKNWVTNTDLGQIPNNRFTLVYNGQSKYRLGVDVTGLAPNGTSPGDLRAKVQLKYRLGPSGFTSGVKVFVALRTREQLDPPQPATDSCVHTMGHEVGHYLGLTADTLPNPTGSNNRYWYQGTGGRTNYNFLNPPPPDNVDRATDNGAQIGLGSHCKWNSGAYNQARLRSGKLPDNASPICFMYHALTTPVTVSYCPNCVKLLRGRDLSSPPVGGTDPFS